MPRNGKSLFACQDCGHQAPKWMGRCPACGQWNTMVEERVEPVPGPHRRIAPSPAQPIQEISLSREMRLRSDISEFDRTLGGGLVPGSLVLVGGDPGIGKSTLILQVLDRLCQKVAKGLYCSGEESPQQIKLRAERIGIQSKGLYILSATSVEDLFKTMEDLKPDVLVVDSIQTFYTESLSSAPGSVAQVREVASRFLSFAKSSGVPVFLIGHVTKEGAIAGPKVLEHLVDTVLYFEGDRGHVFRILRSVKNRYGATNEIGVFEMKESGLEEVGNPSRIFLQERPREVPGSVVTPCLEGTRPVLVEIQALVGPSPFGMPRRTAIGVDPHRISLLVAVLGKRMGMEMGDQDIFVNVAGGLTVEEPAADLAIVSAMMSSHLGKPVPRDLVVFGEVGLAGEIRGVSQAPLRIKEATKLGFARVVLSKTNLEGLPPDPGLGVIAVESVGDLMEALFTE
jgi:DNA repair protein RadA/Sms